MQNTPAHSSTPGRTKSRLQDRKVPFQGCRSHTPEAVKIIGSFDGQSAAPATFSFGPGPHQR